MSASDTGATPTPGNTRLTPAEEARAEAFEIWMRADRVEHDSEQLVLDLFATPTAAERVAAPPAGDPDGLESVGSVLRRWLADLYAQSQVAA